MFTPPFTIKQLTALFLLGMLMALIGFVGFTYLTIKKNHEEQIMNDKFKSLK